MREREREGERAREGEGAREGERERGREGEREVEGREGGDERYHLKLCRFVNCSAPELHFSTRFFGS